MVLWALNSRLASQWLFQGQSLSQVSPTLLAKHWSCPAALHSTSWSSFFTQDQSSAFIPPCLSPTMHLTDTFASSTIQFKFNRRLLQKSLSQAPPSPVILHQIAFSFPSICNHGCPCFSSDSSTTLRVPRNWRFFLEHSRCKMAVYCLTIQDVNKGVNGAGMIHLRAFVI